MFKQRLPGGNGHITYVLAHSEAEVAFIEDVLSITPDSNLPLIGCIANHRDRYIAGGHCDGDQIINGKKLNLDQQLVDWSPGSTAPFFHSLDRYFTPKNAMVI